MAVLQKIREKSGLLIGVIGFSLFAFIIGGLFEGGITMGSRNVGSIDGVDIPTQSFQMKVQMAQQNGQTQGSQVYNTVWNNEVRNILLGTEFEKTGLRMGKDQLINVIKTHPNFGQNPQFLNEAGQFDMAKLNTFIAQMKAGGPEQWNAWKTFEADLEKFAKEQMYYTLIKSSVITTNLEAKFAYMKDNDKATFDFVGVTYASINDDQVKITDAEIEGYVKKYPNQFKTQNSREVEYVFIENKASKEDETAAKTIIEDFLKPSVVFNSLTKKNDTVQGFKNAKNVVEYVNANSDVAYDSTYYSKAELPAEFAEQLYNLPAGEVFGPYMFNNHYCISKLVSKKEVTESVDASHILIAYKDAQNAAPTVVLTKEEAKAKADDLLKQLEANPGNFAALATTNTDDPGSKDKGGKYEGVKQGQMVPAFDTYIFNNPIGKLGIVETDFGFHVLKVDNKTNKEAVQLATIAKTIEASEATSNALYSQATKFEEGAATKEFSKLATELGLIAQPVAKVGAFDDQLPGVGPNSDAISWAYRKNTDIGDIKRFDTPEGYLIIKLVSVNETGLMTATEAKGMVEPILKKQKKAEMIRKQMAGTTLEEVAKNAKVAISVATEVAGSNSTIPNFGQEPEVVGRAVTLKANELSKLIDGNNGVYMIKGKSVTKAPELPNYNAFKSRVTTNNRNSVQNAVYGALYNKAEIEDNRAKILLQ
ncbi:peptidylprolyl isomerase [Paenimyroides tangerinum]|uniref:Peptidylprolyl isomerase n=1 Tax=Paenimyroides tangerinum TaxID=2488728 RepID=A0A3P3VZ21_9FLAO|nr:peptidylprolyl isomerase [Paenimyroides tangerinum]RRJ88071.1 peptidylprolyl isomerase [Paenimyroides tangerinum]